MLNSWLVGLAVLCASAPSWAGQVISPNPKMTYGDLCNEKDPDYVGRRYGENIPYCGRRVTEEQKHRIYEAYGIPAHCRRSYTIDHFIPLAIGGSNRDENLWPEHRYVKATRQFLEQNLFDQVRRGEIRQRQAIKIITQAKMHPDQPRPWRCGVSDEMYFSAAEDEAEYQ